MGDALDQLLMQPIDEGAHRLVVLGRGERAGPGFAERLVGARRLEVGADTEPLQRVAEET